MVMVMVMVMVVKIAFKGEDCEKADAPLASDITHKLHRQVS